ncbi:MAG: 50S ribosomal protein L17 [Pelagibacterales bacterium]|nr:50S ribosomal protein L17 [Pelagibacterales bacterium]OUU62127.1 MAG: 50S ribosomal protein L17 [Alphaproteobacteria bacterium TMED62]|tara:strand:- start:8401 stop:8850 length:450 start_codon:yes stop_codon:yes gene_type:complete
MRHRLKGRKLNRTSAHRKAMFKNLAASLIKYEQITTTLPKAKDLRPIVEKMITIAKKGSLHARRQLISKLPRDADIKKLFEELPKRYENRAGGYIRILKKGVRFGDAAPLAVIELIERNENEKNQDIPKKSQIKEEVKSGNKLENKPIN